MDIFGNLRYELIFWIYSGVNKVSVVGTGGFCKKDSVFSTFSHVFLHTFPFIILSYVEQIKNPSLGLE